MGKFFLKAKRTLSLVGLSTSALALVLSFGSVSPSYAAHKVPGPCSLATVNGKYALVGDGFQIIGGKRVPLAYAGFEQFDGHGHTQGIVSLSTNGTVESRRPFTGTYTVSPNCAMTVKNIVAGVGTLHFNKFTTSDGSRITFLQTDPGVVASGWLTRAEHEAPGPCSLATMNGRYLFAGDGFQIIGGKRVPLAYAGFDLFDGHGHLQGTVSQSVNGKIIHIRFPGTYTVRPDCVVTETDFVQGAILHFDDFSLPDGSKFTFIETDPGFVTSAVATRKTG